MLDKKLELHFQDNMEVQPAFSRQLVSFQANKERAFYRWYRYKEAFSATLVENLLCQYGVVPKRLLDPFAGSGTALFAASQLGCDAEGVELLSIGQEIIKVRSLF